MGQIAFHDDDVPPEVIAAIVAALRAVVAQEEDEPEVSRWSQRGLIAGSNWQRRSRSRWLDRARMRMTAHDGAR